MAKKILAPRRRRTEAEVLGYTLPVFHDKGKSIYVDFYALDPALGTMRRKKYHLDRYVTKSLQKRNATTLICVLSEKLRNGWNPWCDASSDRHYTEIGTVLDRYTTYFEKTCRPRTRENYRSRVKIFREYNDSRHRPLKYAYEFDREFCIEFLDYILLDRDAGPRTRNNYKCWLSGFGAWMQERKYIEDNPAEGIPKISENPKKRQPLTKEMMRQLHRHLREEDRYFLLACLMEYYTFIRPTELSNLRIQDIRLKDKSIFVSKEYSKNKRDGYVGLNDTIIRLMLDLGILTLSGDLYLFGKHFRPSAKKEDADQFNKRWGLLRKRMGWGDEYQFYSLKDTGIRDLANSAGVVVARDQARHTDIATTNRYLGASRTVHSETQSFLGALEPVELTTDQARHPDGRE